MSVLGRVSPRWSASPAAALALMTLAVATAASWVLLPHLDMMTAAPALFLLAWAVMMAAMMLPSVAPLVLLYRRGGRFSLVLGYLLVWAAVGVPVFFLSRAVDLMEIPTFAVAGVLVLAGLYQFSPVKDVCLRVCRSPLDFLALRWGRSPLRLGVEHGLYCAGCCWALMAVLVVAAAMNLLVAAAIGAIVCAEKALPGGRWTGRVAGIGLVVASLVTLI
jgi:predicted metal-binding membrane protein